MKWTSESLAAYTVGLDPADIPGGTRRIARLCLLDLLGAAIAGRDTRAAAATRALAARYYAGGPATLWFTTEGRMAPAAAWANSAAASALDLDDGHRAAGGHPGAAVIPAALAAAEQAGADGAALLTAMAAGYEVAVRVAAGRDFSTLDTLSTGRWCAYGVVAAAGRLYGVSVRQMAEAMAIAGVLSPGLSAAGYSQVMGNDAKEGIAWATFTGMTALDLARHGYTGPADILDHPAYFDAPRIKDGLGGSFALDGVYFKPYACCRWIHGAIDALVAILARQRIDPDRIEAVTVETFARALRLNNYPDPDCLEAAQYSLPFCLAVAALQGTEALQPLSEASLNCPQTVALARRVRLCVDPELDRAFPEHTAARVRLHTADGIHEQLVYDPLGDAGNPMSQDELENKFVRLTRGQIGAEAQAALIDAVRSVEQQPLAVLTGLLRRL